MTPLPRRYAANTGEAAAECMLLARWCFVKQRFVLGTMGRSRRGTRRFADVYGGLIELMQAAGTCAAATRDTGPAYLDTTVALRDQSTAGTTI